MKEQIRIAVVYTGMPVSLVDNIESQIKKALDERAVTFLSLSDPSIIADAVKNGSPSKEAAKRLFFLYQTAVMQGADIVYNACSSVGDIAEDAKPAFARMGVPFIRIDEYMARKAVLEHRRIGVLATLSSTLEPTKRLIEKVAREEGRDITITGALADGAFGLSSDELSAVLIEKARSVSGETDCILLAQGSMGSSKKAIENATGKPVYDSPSHGALAVAEIANEIF
ncbi:MAG: aspartate/glutamate racemase family protein [Christensenellales bacterium]|jgi:hypothetical protein